LALIFAGLMLLEACGGSSGSGGGGTGGTSAGGCQVLIFGTVPDGNYNEALVQLTIR
jgi:hypothetical protein